MIEAFLEWTRSASRRSGTGAKISSRSQVFAAKYGARAGRSIAGLTPAARACLLQYSWPGNVREIENAIERAVVLGATEWIVPEDLPEAIVEAAPSLSPETGYHYSVREAKRRIILGALETAGGSQVIAAKLMGLNPTYLARLMKNLDCRGQEAE